MNQEIYDELVRCATTRRLAAYSHVAPLVGLDTESDADRKQMSRLLREIAEFEHANHRPKLTALVIHKGRDNNAGEGFFAIAQEFALFEGSRDDIERTKFWSRQVADVFAQWQRRTI
jgi:hypothetical protein